MDEFERAKQRLLKSQERRARRLAKAAGLPAPAQEVSLTEKAEPKAQPKAESKAQAILLGGQRYTIPEAKKEGLRLTVVCQAFGREETFVFYHPRPEAYVSWQYQANMKEMLRLALNTRLPGLNAK